MLSLVGVALSAAVAALGLRAAVRRLRRESACCEAEETFPSPKALKGAAIGSKVVHLRGMHCETCQRRVASLLEAIEGVSARVDLLEQHAVVAMSRAVSDEEIHAALSGSGYQATEIEGGFS